MTADLAEFLAWARGARSLLAATAVLALYIAFHGLTGSTPLFVVFVGATWALELGWLIRRALIAPKSSEAPPVSPSAASASASATVEPQ